MTNNNNPVIKSITFGGHEKIASVSLHQNEWIHIQEGHPEVEIVHIINTIEQPVSVHEDLKKANSILITGACRSAIGNHPMRVWVKTLGIRGNYIQTAYYSSRPPHGLAIWVQPEKTDG